MAEAKVASAKRVADIKSENASIQSDLKETDRQLKQLESFSSVDLNAIKIAIADSFAKAMAENKGFDTDTSDCDKLAEISIAKAKA